VTVHRESKVKKQTNKMPQIWCLFTIYCLNMFRASLCPSSGEPECILLHVVFCTACDGRYCEKLGREPCALGKVQQRPSHPVQNTICGKSQSCSLCLLTMGIMMPETCWDNKLWINIRFVASCWSLSSSYYCCQYLRTVTCCVHES
jgi:hypothetical protein